MAKKSSARARKAAPRSKAVPRYRQLLMVLTAVPMVTGLFLFIASWFDFVLVGTAESQTLAGALLALGGFAAANALQGLWRLVAGWLLIAAAIWLAVTQPLSPLRWVAVAAGAVGLGLVLASFIERYREVRRSEK